MLCTPLDILELKSQIAELLALDQLENFLLLSSPLKTDSAIAYLVNGSDTTTQCRLPPSEPSPMTRVESYHSERATTVKNPLPEPPAQTIVIL